MIKETRTRLKYQDRDGCRQEYPVVFFVDTEKNVAGIEVESEKKDSPIWTLPLADVLKSIQEK